MAANTGRTVSHFVNLVISDSGDTLRDIPINSNNLSVVGVTYDQEEGIVAFQDAVNAALPNMPSAPISFGGPFDTTAAQAASGTGVAPAYSGSHIVLSALNGLMTPLSLDIQFGIRQTWETGEPQFGITASATSGYLVFEYTVDPNSMLYQCTLNLFPGSSLPAWGTAAET